MVQLAQNLRPSRGRSDFGNLLTELTAMDQHRFQQVVSQARCRALGCLDASNDSHRAVLAALIRGIENPETGVLCEPSLIRNTTRPPDVVLVCPVAGIHVVEVKGIALDDIQALDPGGQFVIQYSSGARSRNPFAQVRNALFDVRDAVQRMYANDLTLPFRYWVMLPRITRKQWTARWGANSHCPPELLFAEDLPGLVDRFQKLGQRLLSGAAKSCWPGEELTAVWRAFGDTSVLNFATDEREHRRTREATLGEMFDEAAETYKSLSDEQQRLSMQNWEKGPRLIRGVAGSGKTIVLANNLARRLHRSLSQPNSLFDGTPPLPRIVVVCFNRSLAPFIRKKIELAYHQRTAKAPPDGVIRVFTINKLMYELSRQGLWRYQTFAEQPDGDDQQARVAAEYLKELKQVKADDPELFNRLGFDAIYVDEGQDVLDIELQLLRELCRSNPSGEPNLYVFYDDAQNLYGRRRPNWQAVGLNITGGRSHVMRECFRNTREIVESAFNVLYGNYAQQKESVPTRDFGDVATLRQQNLLELVDGRWHVGFAHRSGLPPRTTLAKDSDDEDRQIVARLKWLIEEQEVRPQDILVIAYQVKRVNGLARVIERAKISGVRTVRNHNLDKDQHLVQRGQLAVSTVHSSKGYDAYCVLLASANDFPVDVIGRASFYVACTRAIEYLEVFGWRNANLFAEMESAVRAAPCK